MTYWQGRIADQRTQTRSNYPAAPSAGKGILAKYEELLKKAIGNKKTFRACVLGATPETRDLILKYHAELTTVDISIEMILKCTQLMKRKDDKEVIVKSNWLTVPLESNYFDVVLGDGVFNNVVKEDHPKFFQTIRRILKKDGYVILREGTRNSKLKIHSVEEVDKEYIDGKCHWFDAFINLFFYSDLTKLSYNSKTNRTSFANFFKAFEGAYKQKRLSQKTFDAIWWFRSDLSHTFLPQEIFQKNINRYVKTLPISQAKDYQFTQDTFLFYFGKIKK